MWQSYFCPALYIVWDDGWVVLHNIPHVLLEAGGHMTSFEGYQHQPVSSPGESEAQYQKRPRANTVETSRWRKGELKNVHF